MISQAATTFAGDESVKAPLFSVVWHGRNHRKSAEETIAALTAQTCRDFELVVEDCGSTDGTIELFRAAAAGDDRIKVFEQWTTRPVDVLLSALRRCRGQYVAVCPSEGRFLPNALEIVATEFAAQPAFGAVCTRGFLINAFGDALEHADIVTLLFTTYRPFLPAAFFRREALLAAGIERNDWVSSTIVLDLCCRVAVGWGLASCREKVVDCPDPVHHRDGGFTLDTRTAIDETLQLVSHVFHRYGLFAEGCEAALLLESKTNQLGIFWQHFRALGQAKNEEEISGPLGAVLSGLQLQLSADHRTVRSLHRLLCVRSHNLGYLASPINKFLASIACLENQQAIDRGHKLWTYPVGGKWVTRKITLLTVPSAHFHPLAPSWDAMYADLYAMVAKRHEARGQIDLALAMWDRARPPDTANLGSLACQAMLKSPTATGATLAARQRDWVRRYLGDRPAVLLPRNAGPGDKIRIGYHCAFMHGDTMRNMMRNVIAAHDRTKFEIFGYSPWEPPADIKSLFEVWRHTPPPSSQYKTTYSDEEFAGLVRADKIDVFVELTGFSADHRFGAMSLRCAPVQISYLNHTGTSAVPNVDYVLADEICVPSGSPSEQHYSEEIYRLPGCFFCFDYSTSDEPAVTPAPHVRRGYITFGCFGSGGKIGRDIIGIWAQVLRRVPDSVLHIQNDQLTLPGDRRFMTERFELFGIPPKRLILEGGVDRPTLLRAYSQIDISLDTWPYSGGNTIAESVWHGVPVVTYRGDRFSSAYGASLATAAGCSDLVAGTKDQYVELAAELAADGNRLVHLRHKLRSMSMEYGLTDSMQFARRLEEAFVWMLNKERCRNGL